MQRSLLYLSSVSSELSPTLIYCTVNRAVSELSSGSTSAAQERGGGRERREERWRRTRRKREGERGGEGGGEEEKDLDEGGDGTCPHKNVLWDH